MLITKNKTCIAFSKQQSMLVDRDTKSFLIPSAGYPRYSTVESGWECH